MHRAFSEPLAVLTGDSLIILAFDVLAKAAGGGDSGGAGQQTGSKRSWKSSSPTLVLESGNNDKDALNPMPVNLTTQGGSDHDDNSLFLPLSSMDMDMHSIVESLLRSSKSADISKQSTAVQYQCGRRPKWSCSRL